jgi:hypothetical protein
MVTHGMIGAHGSSQTDIGNFVRRLFAAVSICGLVGFGIHHEWRAVRNGDILSELLILGVTLGPAIAYSFGYFYCLPDVLGGSAARRKGTLLRRWSDFARLSVAFAVVLTWIGWCIAIAQMSRREGIEIILGLLAVTCLIPAAVVASEEYLAHTLDWGDFAPSGSGWRHFSRKLIGRMGTRFLKPLTKERTLLAGSALVIVSFLMNTSGGIFFSGISRGFQIVIGESRWITAEYSSLDETLKNIVAQAGRWTYILGIAVAVVALINFVLGRAGNAVRKNRWLACLAGALGVYVLCDFTFGWLWLNPLEPHGFVFAVWLAAWIVPIVVWLWRARRAGEQRQHSQVALMIFYLPIFFISLCFLIFLASFAPGIFFYVIGVLFLWRGLLNEKEETRQLA